MRLLVVPMLLFVLAASAHANQSNPLDLQELIARQQQLRDGILASDARYENLSAEKRQETLDRSGQLLELLAGRQSAEELTEAERKHVSEALVWIDEALAGSTDKERMVCTYEKATGSNRKSRVCRTASEIENERRHSQHLLSRPSVCTKDSPGCT